MADRVAAGLDRQTLREIMKAGAARNALDCALFDVEAKVTGIPAFQTAGIAALEPLTTAYTLSLGDPDSMRAPGRSGGRPSASEGEARRPGRRRAHQGGARRCAERAG